MHRFKHLILFLCALAIPASALAKVEFKQLPPLDLQQPIKAMTSSFDGETLFVLGSDSNLYIYNGRGEELGRTKVDTSLDMIQTSGFKKANIPEFIFLSSSTSGTVQRITYNKIVQFDVAGSPFIGSPNAPVAIVIFSDFQ